MLVDVDFGRVATFKIVYPAPFQTLLYGLPVFLFSQISMLSVEKGAGFIFCLP